ncbi:MAG: DinB family protein [Fuerstiella sp.]
MFKTEIKLNQFLISGLNHVVADLPSDRIFERAPGNGHPPVWVLGHLAICGELGQSFLDGSVTHPNWLATFGPGSSDDIAPTDQFSKDEFLASIHSGYQSLQEMARSADERAMQRPHGVALLDGTKVETAGDLVSHLLTSHFAFHLAQLSAWRRAAGHGPLFERRPPNRQAQSESKTLLEGQALR